MISKRTHYPLLSLLLLINVSCTQYKEQEALGKIIKGGTILKLYSEILEEEREIYVYAPNGFYGMSEQGIKYPVTYVMDGESQFLSAVGVLEQLSSAASANDLIPPMIIVGVVNTDRNRDLTPTPGILGRDSSSIQHTGGAGLMARFLEEELIPYIDSLYATSPHRVLAGHSLGGLFVLNTLIERPELFQNYLVIDPFMRWNDQQFTATVLDALKAKDYPNRRLYIATANNSMSWMNEELVKTDTTDITYLMRSNLDFKEKMDNNELGIRYINKYYEQENHFQVPLLATYDGFRYFYDYYPFEIMDYIHPNKQEEDLIEALQLHYEGISQQLGYEILPQESYINAWAFGFAQFERPAFANDLFDLNISNYPQSPNVYSSKGYHLLLEGDTTTAINYLEQSLEINESAHVRASVESLTQE